MKSIERTVCAAALTAMTFAAVAGPTNVPFAAKLVTQEQIGPNPTQCQAVPYLAGMTSGTGQATHLGRVTGTAEDCIVPPSAGYAYTFSGGRLTLVAANGDELRATYSGTLNPTAVPPIYAITGTYQITGGTGRFTGASGSGRLGGIENLQTGQGQLSLDGTISY